MSLHVLDKPIEPEYGGPDYKREFEQSGPTTQICVRCQKQRDADDCDHDGVCLVCLGEKEELQPTQEIVGIVGILKQINRRFGIN